MARSPSGRRLGDAGVGRLGCLVRLGILAAATYYGLQILDPYVRYLRVRDAMHQQAAFGVTLTDQAIRQRLLEEVRRLGVPKEAERIRIERPGGEKIIIWLEYREKVKLPGFERELHFRPRVERTLWRL